MNTNIAIIVGVVLLVLQRLFIDNALHLDTHFHSEIPLLFQLLKINLEIPKYVLLFADVANALLLFILASRLSTIGVAVVCVLLYALSPWFGYVYSSGSVYILFLLTLQATLIALLSKRSSVMQVVLGMCGALLLMESFYFWLIVPILFIKKSKISSVIVGLVFLCLIILIAKNLSVVKDFFHSFKLFSDIGLVNTVNAFRGESRLFGYPLLSRLVENKIEYYAYHLGSTALLNLSPLTYFTSQAQMYRFSITPPLFTALLIPFLIGLGSITKWTTRAVILGSAVLILPSLLAENSPDLSSLILLSPVIVFITALGFEYLFMMKKTAKKQVILGLVFILMGIQCMMILVDIPLREPIRMQNYFQIISSR